MEKQIVLLVCLLLLSSIGDATDADSHNIWEKFREPEETNQEKFKELEEKNGQLEENVIKLQSELHELKTAQSQREICKYMYDS